MRHRHLDFRHQGRQRLFNLVQILDPGDDIEGLTTAMALTQDRLPDDHRIKRHHEGPNGEAIDGRGRDQAHFANTGQRHLQRPWDRGRGQGQDMDIGLELLQRLFLGDPEMLFFVDDQQAEVLKLHGLCQDRVGADNHVDLAFGQRLAGFRGLLRRHEPR